MTRTALVLIAPVLIAVVAPAARADDLEDPPPRPHHVTVGVGGSLLATGDRGDRMRGEFMVDIKPKSRFGALLAWRTFDREIRGIVMAGVIYEGAASRPRLVLDLHAEVGWDLDTEDPVVGAGIRTTLGIIGPLAVILDGGVYVAIDGLDDSRVQLAGSTLVGAKW